MFRKLQNRFLLLNLSLISVLVMVSFCVIYAMTYQNTMRDIDMSLNMEIRNAFSIQGIQPPGKPDGHATEKRPPNRFKSFSVWTDETCEVTKVNSAFDIDSSVYEAAIQSLSSGKKQEGTVKSESALWRYRTEIRQGTDGGFIIAFLDITSEHAMLTRLIYTFLFVALITLVAVFCISLFFARKAIRPIEQAWEKQKRFVADASHELKTPLTTIGTNVDVLLSHPDAAICDEAKWLVYIKDEAERMTHLTEDLLYLARMDAHADTPMLSRVSFSDAAENTILAMEAVAYEKTLSLSYEIEPDVFVLGDAEKLRQLVMILLDNAIKYTPEGGSIEVSLKSVKQTARFCVANTGEAIPAEDAAHLFDRFYRADASRTRDSGGYGLGLSIAQAIAQMHSGRIFVKSNKEDGTCFFVDLKLT